MQVTNHSNNTRTMKEEMLEAIYGTVERLEQKVDDLSVSIKNAGAETVPASNDTTRLEDSIIAMFGKEEEAIGKISKLRVRSNSFFLSHLAMYLSQPMIFHDPSPDYEKIWEKPFMR